ncbi:hypothetical protein H9Y04_45420 [Streptomyces sp. TRM66268-LWL]|uniref:Uncharacterized protein n=1 Tax=Streptomyces polyasparticus TaxID=2767826 RepID=A0ABR7SW21_9ACTN|nr:hypothetical protein [Streptomyces polyasparticus]MBC9719719.1 hypothetical protein [Streptomyces polyasparticus]
MAAHDTRDSATSAQPACTHCHHRLHSADTHRYLCRHCETRTNERLEELPGLREQLRDMLEPGVRGPRAVVSASRDGSLVPCSLDALNLVAVGGITAVLDAWVADWCDLLGWQLPHLRNTDPGACNTPITGAVTFLRNNLPWAAERHPAVDDFAHAVHQLWQHATSITDPPEPTVRIGYCPAVLDDGTECGATLRATPGDADFRCRWCNTTWAERHCLTLAATLHTAA